MEERRIDPPLMITNSAGTHVVSIVSWCFGLLQIDEDDEMYATEETHDVALVPDQTFGVEFALLTESAKETDIETELTYEIRRPDAQSSEGFVSTIETFDYVVNEYRFIWQKLDTEEEMVPGPWTVTIRSNEFELLRETFLVEADSSSDDH
jgi:Domain of unknown function (DUF3859)